MPSKPNSSIAPTRLLVSVRDADEAKAAFDGGADVIDVKEPSAGPMGAASSQVVVEVCSLLASRRGGRRLLLTAAAGEAKSLPPWLARPPEQLEVAKIGLAGVKPLEAASRLRSIREQTSRRLRLAAVAYADHHRAAAPGPEAVVDAAIAAGFEWIVIDTHDKRGPGSFDLFGSVDLAGTLDRAVAGGLRTVIAGRVEAEQIPAVASLVPDLIGVRGAACRGGRAGTIARDRVEHLIEALERVTCASESLA